jgi:hypothetical protein
LNSGGFEAVFYSHEAVLRSRGQRRAGGTEVRLHVKAMIETGFFVASIQTVSF